MSIPAAAKPTPIPRIDVSTRLVNPQTGVPETHGLQRIERLRSYVTGMGRIIPCSCVSAGNFLTLSPNGNGGEDGESPLIEGEYKLGDGFIFELDASSTGNVTATVVPKTGTLPTLPVHIDDGATQAGNGDLVAGNLYIAYFAPVLGAFVLK